MFYFLLIWLKVDLDVKSVIPSFNKLSKEPSINDVSSEGDGGGTPQKLMKGDENRYLFFGKADVVFDSPKEA